jgi:hypothetical protein
VLQRELFDFLANILPSNFYNAKTISGVAKCQSFSDENLFVDAVAKGYFYGYVLPKNFRTIPAAIFVDVHRYRKINKRRRAVSCEAEGGHRFRFKSVAVSFRCLSFITEFVGISFDAASGFPVLKNEPCGLRDFSGHFLGSGRVYRLVFAWFWGPGARGGSFGVTKPKRDILVAI